MNRSNDRELVLAFQSGDATAYSAIDRKYRPLATRICRRLLINQDDADEAIQETMVRVLTALPRFNGQYRLEAWVARIATNVSLDYIRRSARRPANVESLSERDGEMTIGDERERRVSLETVEDPSETVARIDEARRVVRTLNELPDHHRDALVLREFEGYSHEEIAGHLGVTAPRAKALLHRAKKSFRAAWTGEKIGLRAPRALIPLLFVVRMASDLKRVIVDRGSQAVEMASGVVAPAATQAATTVAQAAPQVSTLATAGGERVAAAGMTAIVAAASLGMGAVVVKQATPVKKPAVTAAAAPRVAAEPPSLVAPAPSADPVAAPSSAPSPTVEASTAPSPAPEPSPAPTWSTGEVGWGTHRGEASTSGSPSPSASPSGSTSPSSSPEAAPSPAPSPPPFAFHFVTATSSDARCGCDATPRVVHSSGHGKAGHRRTTFGQMVRGAALSLEGQPAWAATIEYWGTVDRYTGSMNVKFTLQTPDGPVEYNGLASSGGWTQNDQGGVSYAFQGTYSQAEGAGQGPIGESGNLSLTINFWQDGTTIYRTVVSVS